MQWLVLHIDLNNFSEHNKIKQYAINIKQQLQINIDQTETFYIVIVS